MRGGLGGGTAAGLASLATGADGDVLYIYFLMLDGGAHMGRVDGCRCGSMGRVRA